MTQAIESALACLRHTHDRLIEYPELEALRMTINSECRDLRNALNSENVTHPRYSSGTVDTSEGELYRRRGDDPFLAWKFDGQSTMPLWLIKVYKSSPLPEPFLGYYATATIDGDFWRWFKPDQFERNFVLDQPLSVAQDLRAVAAEAPKPYDVRFHENALDQLETPGPVDVAQGAGDCGAKAYVERAIASYAGDPADNQFQKGFLAALEVVRDEAFPCSVPSTSRATPDAERCLTCDRTDAEYKAGNRTCVDPWHGDDHLRASQVTSTTRDTP